MPLFFNREKHLQHEKNSIWHAHVLKANWYQADTLLRTDPNLPQVSGKAFIIFFPFAQAISIRHWVKSVIFSGTGRQINIAL